MGSGETSPTMVTVHRALVAPLESDRPAAVVLETPYRFQENIGDISARAKAYFARSVGLADPRERLGPAVDSLVMPRAELRRQGSYPAADAIRDALTAAGLELRDTAEGTQWQLAPHGQPVT